MSDETDAVRDGGRDRAAGMGAISGIGAGDAAPARRPGTHSRRRWRVMSVSRVTAAPGLIGNSHLPSSRALFTSTHPEPLLIGGWIEAENGGRRT